MLYRRRFLRVRRYVQHFSAFFELYPFQQQNCPLAIMFCYNPQNSQVFFWGGSLRGAPAFRHHQRFSVCLNRFLLLVGRFGGRPFFCYHQFSGDDAVLRVFVRASQLPSVFR